MPKHNCCAWNCSNSIEKKKQKDKYPELDEVTFHPFPLDNPAKQYVSGMSEKERRQKWIAECRLQSLNVTRHTRICSKHFEGGLGPTKANPVPTLFDFPEHLKRKTPLSRTDPEKRRNSVTPKARKSKKIIPKELYGNSTKMQGMLVRRQQKTMFLFMLSKKQQTLTPMIANKFTGRSACRLTSLQRISVRWRKRKKN